MVARGVPSVLSACTSADSERTREFLARSYYGIVSNNDGMCIAHVQMDNSVIAVCFNVPSN